MTLYVELDFCQNVVGYACRTVETKEAQFKCYNFAIISDQPCDPKCVELEPVKLSTEPWLYGPATDLKTRTIIYPCSRFKCLIPCPCLICEKKNPSSNSKKPETLSFILSFFRTLFIPLKFSSTA